SVVLGRLVDNPFARYTARISFGINVWHYLLIEGFAFISDDWFVYGGVAERRAFLMICLVLLGLTYAVATASWRWIERPALESRWAAGGSREALSPAAAG
ncbi:MAG TPA: hypothetical protein VK935_17105, partial [Actinomycetospora sp.]|nr:hypothetical protein [Actinomycetospora sp.]